MMQAELFTAAPLMCESCQTISPTQFIHDLNHQLVGSTTICMSQHLIAERTRSSTHHPPLTVNDPVNDGSS